MKILPDFSTKSMPFLQALKVTAASKVFPVTYSTLAPDAILSLAYVKYNIEIPKNCFFWHRGLSDIYLIETIGKSYIFRVSHQHWRTKTEIDFELELLTFLKHRNIPVAQPLSTKSGHLSLEIDAPEGKRYAALFHCAPGEIAIGDLNSIQSRLVGETVAKLHCASREFQTLAQRPPLNFKYLLDDSLQIIAPFLHHRKQELKYLVKTISYIKETVKELPQKPPFWGICWGDPHSGNVHFTPDNQMTLFDFDQCGYGWRIFDLAKFLQVSLQTGLSRKIRQAFLEGYQTVEKLTDLEESLLHPLTEAAYIWSWAINLNTTKLHDYSRLDDSYFTHRLCKLKHLASKDWELF